MALSILCIGSHGAAGIHYEENYGRGLPHPLLLPDILALHLNGIGAESDLLIGSSRSNGGIDGDIFSVLGHPLAQVSATVAQSESVHSPAAGLAAGDSVSLAGHVYGTRIDRRADLEDLLLRLGGLGLIGVLLVVGLLGLLLIFFLLLGILMLMLVFSADAAASTSPAYPCSGWAAQRACSSSCGPGPAPWPS